mmetsp:Transcript_20430/g.26409  ORF Transcript_20430/g.26409 Transcript_20430/m.26409 type:complete len:507 (-) Transcript_20430:689-2209(-)
MTSKNEINRKATLHDAKQLDDTAYCRGDGKKGFSLQFVIAVAALSGFVMAYMFSEDNMTSLPDKKRSWESLDVNSPSMYQHFDCTEENLEGLLLDTNDAFTKYNMKIPHGVPGLHVLCLSRNENEFIDLRIYKSALNESLTELGISPGPRQLSVMNNFQSLHTTLVNEFRLTPTLNPSRATKQNWALYTPNGSLIYRDDELNISDNRLESILNLALSSGIILLYEGGIFVWPGVRVGYRREVEVSSLITSVETNHLLFSDFGLFGRDEVGSSGMVTLETTSIVPLIFTVQNFLTEEECDLILSRAEPTMKSSTISHNDEDMKSPSSKWRTSSSTFLYPRKVIEDDVLLDIDRRVASLTRIPLSHQEVAQVLKYNYLQKYNSHNDYFDNNLYKRNPDTQTLIQGGRRNRLATVFWYLSDVDEGGGGETIFPRWNGRRAPRDLSDCSVGLKVRPEKGKVLLFYSMAADGNLDPYSLHGACPILKKEFTKWAANKWVWNSKMDFMNRYV